MSNQQPDFFFSNYPFILREICSFFYFLFTISWLALLGVAAFLITVVAPLLIFTVVAMFFLRGAGLIH